ncbi:hypothetical protein ABH939_005958 [Rhodococcus sp. 27YEA6]
MSSSKVAVIESGNMGTYTVDQGPMSLSTLRGWCHGRYQPSATASRALLARGADHLGWLRGHRRRV